MNLSTWWMLARNCNKWSCHNNFYLNDLKRISKGSIYNSYSLKYSVDCLSCPKRSISSQPDTRSHSPSHSPRLPQRQVVSCPMCLQDRDVNHFCLESYSQRSQAWPVIEERQTEAKTGWWKTQSGLAGWMMRGETPGSFLEYFHSVFTCLSKKDFALHILLSFSPSLSSLTVIIYPSFNINFTFDTLDDSDCNDISFADLYSFSWN